MLLRKTAALTVKYLSAPNQRLEIIVFFFRIGTPKLHAERRCEPLASEYGTDKTVRANMAHKRRKNPGSGLDFKVKVRVPFLGVSVSSFGICSGVIWRGVAKPGPDSGPGFHTQVSLGSKILATYPPPSSHLYTARVFKGVAKSQSTVQGSSLQKPTGTVPPLEIARHPVLQVICKHFALPLEPF